MSEAQIQRRAMRFRLAVFFILIFTVSCLIQGFEWREFDMTDSGMWGHQAEYFNFRQSPPREFDFKLAYGHPGGPIIEGAFLIHWISLIPYDHAVLALVTILNSLGIAAVCLLCNALRKDKLWWIAVFGILTLNELYGYATPPTAIASVFATLLALVTLYMYEQQKPTTRKTLGAWALTAGILISTRTDIGAFTFLVFLGLLFSKIGWRKVFWLIAGSFAVFCIFDPFMWFMPFQHIKDLIFKMVFHYAEFNPSHLSFSTIVMFSLVSFISMALGFVFVFYNKKQFSPIKPVYILTVFGMTVALYAIFLTSNFQAVRYFLPILFIWETLLPLFIFRLIDAIQPTFTSHPENIASTQQWIKIFFVALLYGYNLVFLVQNLWLYNLFHLLP